MISVIIQSGGFLGALLSKLAGLVMKVVAVFINILPASAVDVGIQKKIHREGITLMISNEDMGDIKTIKLLEDLGVVIDGLCKTVKKKRANWWIA